MSYWLQTIYFILFASGALLVKSWAERFAILIAACLFTIPPYVYLFLLPNWFDVVVADRDKLLWFVVAEFMGLALLPLLTKGIRSTLITILQLIAVSYFIFEYLNWYIVTWTWQYYEVINMVLLDLTLAALIVKPTKYLTILHFLIYSGVMFLSWYYQDYINTYL